VEGDDRTGEALTHLQAAAREAIAAARAFLDVADELVADPKAAAAIAEAIGSVVRTAARKGRAAAGAAGGEGGDDSGDDRVQRIRIS
jgi:hypothetical protein